MNKYWWLAAAALIASLGTRPRAAQAQAISPARDAPSRARDWGREVLGVFSAKCADCHGPDLPKPKGRFGYILDLERVAADSEKVIPPNPDESELWDLVKHNEMPPPDSPRGPLTNEQKEIIRAWIAAGAPKAWPAAPKSAVTTTPEPAASVRPESSVAVPIESSDVDRFLVWLGKFHLLLLHFPIALVIAAGFAEALATWQRRAIPSESVRFCLWLAALAAIPTAILGWLFAAAGNGDGSPQLLTAHRWLGTTAAVWLAITAIGVERDAHCGLRSHLVRILLMLGILITAITAHLGGLLDHGTDFFNY